MGDSQRRRSDTFIVTQLRANALFISMFPVFSSHWHIILKRTEIMWNI